MDALGAAFRHRMLRGVCRPVRMAMLPEWSAPLTGGPSVNAAHRTQPAQQKRLPGSVPYRVSHHPGGQVDRHPQISFLRRS